jgi:hypothetical protein
MTMILHWNYRNAAIVAATTVFMTFSVQASASSVNEVANLISKNVLRYVEDHEKKELFIDQFKGPKTSGGRLLETLIRQKLKADGVTILEDDVEASWTLQGRLSTDTSGKNAIVTVTVELLNAHGNSIAEFKRRFREDPEVKAELVNSLPVGSDSSNIDAALNGADDVARIIATTVDNQSPVEAATGRPVENDATTTNGVTAEGIKKALVVRALVNRLQKEAIETPKVFLDGPTHVKASQSSGFGIEIRVSATENGPFVSVPVQSRGGRAIVDLQQDQFFQVHVFNSENFDVGVQLNMDGINIMYFAEGQARRFREDGKWLIPAGTEAAVKGWFIAPAQFDRFVIKAVPDGVAAALGRPHRIGTIQASFFMARAPKQGRSDFTVFFPQMRYTVERFVSTIDQSIRRSHRIELEQVLARISILYLNPVEP